MARIAVIGAGAWGSALAVYAARMDAAHEVRLWAREPEVVEEITACRRNTLFLPEVLFPESVLATTDRALALDGAELVLLVVPSRFVRDVAGSLRGLLPRDAVLAVASKGIEERSLMLLSEVLAEVLPEVPTDAQVFLSGPSFAREVASGLPTDLVAASLSMHYAERVQACLHSPMLRIYTSDDPVGVELGGALKNVLAVAAGICDGLELGRNARAALLTRGLAEMTRLGVALGANPLTFIGMAGVGDLFLTATGDLSRNRQLGLEVARGTDPAGYLAARRTVAEGFGTAAAAWALAQRHGVDMPITEQVYHVLHRGRPLADAVRALVTRSSKEELAGVREALARVFASPPAHPPRDP